MPVCVTQKRSLAPTLTSDRLRSRCRFAVDLCNAVVREPRACGSESACPDWRLTDIQTIRSKLEQKLWGLDLDLNLSDISLQTSCARMAQDASAVHLRGIGQRDLLGALREQLLAHCGLFSVGGVVSSWSKAPKHRMYPKRSFRPWSLRSLHDKVVLH